MCPRRLRSASRVRSGPHRAGLRRRHDHRTSAPRSPARCRGAAPASARPGPRRRRSPADRARRRRDADAAGGRPLGGGGGDGVSAWSVGHDGPSGVRGGSSAFEGHALVGRSSHRKGGRIGERRRIDSNWAKCPCYSPLVHTCMLKRRMHAETRGFRMHPCSEHASVRRPARRRPAHRRRAHRRREAEAEVSGCGRAPARGRR